MNKELVERAESLWKQDERLGRLGSRFNYTYAPGATGKVFEGIKQLESEIPERVNPINKDELYEADLKRGLQSRMLQLEHFLEGKPYSVDSIIKLYGLDQADLDAIQPWLKANREDAIQALEGLFKSTEVESYEYGLYTDIPRVQRQAEGFAATQISNYHRKLSSLFKGLTHAGEFLYRITPEPSTADRSYFASKSKVLAVSMARICYQEEDGTIQLRERELIRLFGHEGMGHGLHSIITEASDVPFFLKESSHAADAVEESIAQHFEKVIFDDLKNSPDVQRDLRIQDRFPEIYEEEKNTRLVNAYNRMLFYYSILVLADKSIGDPEDPETLTRKMELIGKHTINRGYARNIVERNRREFDSKGNLSASLTSELRYSSRAVQRGLEVFEKHGIIYDHHEERSQIDMTFLTGYYTPIGFVQKTILAASGII